MTRRGFTLMETLVAVTLMLVLGGSIFAFAAHVTTARQRLSDHMRTEQALRTFLDRLEGDVAMTLVADARHGVGVRGDERSLMILSRSVSASRASGPQSRFDGSGVPFPGPGGVLGDLQRSEYRWNAATQSLDGRRGPAGEAGQWFEIARGLGSVRFRYHDGSGWSGSFDSRQRRSLPVAVEVAIWLHPLPEGIGAELDEWGEDEEDFGFAGGDPRENGFPRPPLSSDLPAPDRVRLIVVPDGPEFDYGRRFEPDDEIEATDRPDDDFDLWSATPGGERGRS